MTQTNLGRHLWAVVLTASSMVLASGGTVRAAEGEDDASPVAAPETPPPPKVEPQPAAPAITSEAPPVAVPEAAPASAYIEHMGPNTFPGHSRGIYGGSLWLEPTFHGLQWPQNARTGLGVSASFWIDSGYEKVTRGNEKVLDSTMKYQQGRAVLRLTPAYVEGNFFIQGQAELVGNLCQTASFVNTVCNQGTMSTDDLFIRVGQWNAWDVKVGRFQGWEIYHLGMGLDPYTLERNGAGMWGSGSLASPGLEAPAFYGVNYLQDRPTDGLAVGYAAAHYYPIDLLRVELLGKLGTDNYRNDNETGDHPFTSYGGRLAAILDTGWLKVKAGAEYQKRTPVYSGTDANGTKVNNIEELVQKGAGGSMQFVVDPIVEFGLSAAIGKQSYTDITGNKFGSSDTAARSFTTKSVGGFANLRVFDGFLLGAGAHWTTQEDDYRDTANNSKANDYTTHLQTFFALQYLLAKQLYIKGVVAYSKAKFQPSNPNTPIWDNTMFPSARVRLMYLY